MCRSMMLMYLDRCPLPQQIAIIQQLISKIPNKRQTESSLYFHVFTLLVRRARETSMIFSDMKISHTLRPCARQGSFELEQRVIFCNALKKWYRQLPRLQRLHVCDTWWGSNCSNVTSWNSKDLRRICKRGIHPIRSITIQIDNPSWPGVGPLPARNSEEHDLTKAWKGCS